MNNNLDAIQEKKRFTEYIYEQMEHKIPLVIIAHKITEDLQLDQTYTEQNIKEMIGEDVYNNVRHSYSKNIHQAVLQFVKINKLNIPVSLLKDCYTQFLNGNILIHKVEDYNAERKANEKRYNTVPIATDPVYEQLLTQSNVDEEKLRISNNMHRDKLRRYSRELVKYKSIFELFNDMNDLLSDSNFNYSTPLQNIPTPVPNADSADLIAMWSDHHFGEVIKKSTINSLNEYNLSIAYSRFRELVDKTIDKYLTYSKIYNINTLYLDIIGDMFSGDIHEDLQLSNERRTTVVVVSSALMVAQGIHELLKVIPNIVVSGSYGNHSRLSEKKTFKNHADNYDYMFLQILSTFFPNEYKQNRIKFNLELNEFHLHERRGFNFLLEHGDNFRSIKNVEREIEARIVGFQRAQLPCPDYIEIGHFHQETEFSNLGIYVNGSLKGTDEYVFHSWKAFSKPSQKLMILTDKGIQETLNLKLNISPEKIYKFDFEKNPVIGELFSSFV